MSRGYRRLYDQCSSVLRRPARLGVRRHFVPPVGVRLGRVFVHLGSY